MTSLINPPAATPTLELPAAGHLEVENTAPEYWKEAGGAHWTVRASCGANASALRFAGEEKWTVFGCYGEQLTFPASWSDAKIRNHLRDLLRLALKRSLDTECAPEPE